MNFIRHFIAGLLCFLAFAILAFGIGQLIHDTYAALIFISIIPSYATFIYLTTIFKTTLSVIQYFLTGILALIANGLTEPQYHFLFNYNIGAVFDFTTLILIGVSVTIAIKIFSDFVFKLFKVQTRQSVIEKILPLRRQQNN